MELEKNLYSTSYFRQRIKRFALLCFILYFVFLGYITLFTYNYYVYGPSFNIVIFDSIKRMLRSGNYWLFFKNVIGNILLFLPLGFLLPLIHRKMRNFFYMTLIGILLSTFIELIQFTVAKRIFDVDDIFLNTVGAILGFILFHLIALLYRITTKLLVK
jgi:glycopeptide antibiotics resistance protein